MRDNEVRKRKWKLYHMAVDWISPAPFSKLHGFDNKYAVKDFVEHFKISKEEATQLINKLIKDKKLIPCENDKFESVRFCSLCGKKFDEWDIQGNNHIVHHFGFGSSHDLEVFDADLCLDCYDKIVDKILPMFPNVPIERTELYQDEPYAPIYIQRMNEHNNDPF